MYKIALVNMPFATIGLPSIALTQIKQVVKKKFGDRAEPKIIYVNHDFENYFGSEYYHLIANDLRATTVGLGDWLFRLATFPEQPDNALNYYTRYMWQFADNKEFIANLDEKRDGITAFLDGLIDGYGLADYSLVGFTCMFSQNLAAMAMAGRLKSKNPNVVTVMGGANCETSMGAMIAKNIDVIDFVFSGPALKSFPQLVDHLIRKEETDCHRIKGVFSRKRLTELEQGKYMEIGEELDIGEDIPLDYDDFLASLDEKCPDTTEEIGLLIETSRGCWWGQRSQCRFCGLNASNLKHRSMSPDMALVRFEDLFKHAPRVLYFKAVDNVVPKSYLSEVFPYLRTPPDAEVFYEVRTSLKDADLKSMAEAGVTRVQGGVEALNTASLKRMCKGVTAFQNIRFLAGCIVHGINNEWNLLIGFPGEEEDVYQTYWELIPSLHHLQPPTGVYPIRFDRYSYYFEHTEEFGLDLKPNDFYAYLYPFSPEDLYDMCYFFVDGNYNAGHIALAGKWLRKLESRVEKWRSRWHRHDNLLKPELTYLWKGDSRVVHDTRTGDEIEHDVGETCLKILDLCSAPQRPDRLTTHLEGVSGPALAEKMTILQQKGLLFQEGGRYMSLVVDTGLTVGYL